MQMAVSSYSVVVVVAAAGIRASKQSRERHSHCSPGAWLQCSSDRLIGVASTAPDASVSLLAHATVKHDDRSRWRPIKAKARARALPDGVRSVARLQSGAAVAAGPNGSARAAIKILIHYHYYSSRLNEPAGQFGQRVRRAAPDLVPFPRAASEGRQRCARAARRAASATSRPARQPTGPLVSRGGSCVFRRRN